MHRASDPSLADCDAQQGACIFRRIRRTDVTSLLLLS
jgi:hypothetical protein